MNTFKEAGAQGDENGKDLYKKFHEKIEKIKKTENTGFLGERGIIFDIHGKVTNLFYPITFTHGPKTTLVYT